DKYCLYGTHKIKTDNSVLNYVNQPPYVQRDKVENFLYVGRLVDVKNLIYLINVFNKLPSLTLRIVGFGPLEGRLKHLAKSNIIFEGAVNNDKLSSYYQQNDVFILPSYSEPWGLVVEEALNNGMPVIVSNRVGCNRDLVTSERGLVFDINEYNSLENAINRITEIDFYNHLRKNISKMNFGDRTAKQVNLYI
ncbi:MAG: glycosyltransferase family 4 protein, partial [Bacteroides sp.]|nr:glycosyltransferase family 4 protein [Bacteroides sp.]